MKKLKWLICSLGVTLAMGCSDSYDDTALSGRVDNLEQRVSALEELCRQLNTNITSVQTLVNVMTDNDYITGVKEHTENGKVVGYVISFAKSDDITIYHGRDGETGNDGKDGSDGSEGSAPSIGVRLDEDGLYYWTINGEWLLDDNGNHVKASAVDGKDGADGKDGSDGKEGLPGPSGKDAATPQFKIEDGDWYVSTDNGYSWQYVGPASYAGSDGKDGSEGNNGSNGNSGTDGKDGNFTFSNIDTTDNEFVIFTLSNGTQIKIPTWYAFEELEKLCNRMNTNIESLQTIVEAMEQNDYIVSCTPLIEDGKPTGYTITFSQSGSIVIYHGKDGADGSNGTNGDAGKDGHTPAIGVREDDGVLYWTVDGDFLTDEEGQKLPVTGKDGANGTDGTNGEKGEKGKDGENGATPRFKIEDGYWYITFTEGDEDWQKLDKATGDDGADGDSFFDSVTEDENFVHIKLKDSSDTIDIPKNKPMDVTFTETEDILVEGGKTYSIGYTVTGIDGNAVVKAYAQDGYRAQVVTSGALTGSIVITAPRVIVPSEILVFVSDGKQRTIMRSINFVADVIVISNKNYYVGNTGGTVNVEVLTNLEYDVEIDASSKNWVSLAPKSRALLRTDNLEFIVAQNSDASQRTAKIDIKYKDETRESFLIIQHAGGVDAMDDPNGRLAEMVGDQKDVLESLIVTGRMTIFDYEFLNSMKNLKYLDLSGIENTTMPTSCFWKSTISTVILPEKLTAIPDRAFYQSEITGIVIPETVLTIGDYAFAECKNAKGDIIIPDAVYSIGSHCFYQSTFDGKLSLGKDVCEIGDYAFAFSKITGDIDIPDAVLSLGSYAFYWSNFTGNIRIGNSLEEIPENCFHRCYRASGTLTIGNNVKKIGSHAFDACYSLSGNLIIPDNVETIGSYAFHYCIGFEGYLSIGKNVSDIGSLAFVDNNTTLKKLNFNKYFCKALTPPTITSFTFYGYYGLYLGIPVGTKEAYSTSDYWKDFGTIEEIDAFE